MDSSITKKKRCRFQFSNNQQQRSLNTHGTAVLKRRKDRHHVTKSSSASVNDHQTVSLLHKITNPPPSSLCCFHSLCCFLSSQQQPHHPLNKKTDYYYSQSQRYGGTLAGPNTQHQSDEKTASLHHNTSESHCNHLSDNNNLSLNKHESSNHTSSYSMFSASSSSEEEEPKTVCEQTAPVSSSLLTSNLPKKKRRTIESYVPAQECRDESLKKTSLPRFHDSSAKETENRNNSFVPIHTLNETKKNSALLKRCSSSIDDILEHQQSSLTSSSALKKYNDKKVESLSAVKDDAHYSNISSNITFSYQHFNVALLQNFQDSNNLVPVHNYFRLFRHCPSRARISPATRRAILSFAIETGRSIPAPVSDFSLHMAINLFDRYLSALGRSNETIAFKEEAAQEVEAIGAACLFLCSKLDDVWMLSLGDLCKTFDEGSEKRRADILRWELEITRRLQFKLTSPTVFDFLYKMVELSVPYFEVWKEQGGVQHKNDNTAVVKKQQDSTEKKKRRKGVKAQTKVHEKNNNDGGGGKICKIKQLQEVKGYYDNHNNNDNELCNKNLLTTSGDESTTPKIVILNSTNINCSPSSVVIKTNCESINQKETVKCGSKVCNENDTVKNSKEEKSIENTIPYGHEKTDKRNWTREAFELVIGTEHLGWSSPSYFKETYEKLTDSKSILGKELFARAASISEIVLFHHTSIGTPVHLIAASSLLFSILQYFGDTCERTLSCLPQPVRLFLGPDRYRLSSTVELVSTILEERQLVFYGMTPKVSPSTNYQPTSELNYDFEENDKPKMNRSSLYSLTTASSYRPSTESNLELSSSSLIDNESSENHLGDESFLQKSCVSKNDTQQQSNNAGKKKIIQSRKTSQAPSLSFAQKSVIRSKRTSPLSRLLLLLPASVRQDN